MIQKSLADIKHLIRKATNRVPPSPDAGPFYDDTKATQLFEIMKRPMDWDLYGGLQAPTTILDFVFGIVYRYTNTVGQYMTEVESQANDMVLEEAVPATIEQQVSIAEKLDEALRSIYWFHYGLGWLLDPHIDNIDNEVRYEGKDAEGYKKRILAMGNQAVATECTLKGLTNTSLFMRVEDKLEPQLDDWKLHDEGPYDMRSWTFGPFVL
jgi:hypothetical protein